jgi:hypothetical protein
MRRTVFIAAALLLTATAASAAPLLVESYQEGQISFPTDDHDTVKVTEVSFSVDSSCYIQFAAGGRGQYLKIWLVLDGEVLPPEIFMELSKHAQQLPITPIIYTYLVEPGKHTVYLELTGYGGSGVFTICNDVYLQALIFLPDETGAIAKRPAGDVDADATGAMTSVISAGPYVTVTGATELVDATGRVIEHAIEEDRVSINNLSQGTYFARKEGKTLVKIVKVD